ncbi:MAG: adenosine kinase [Bacteriovoracaceae bacterium]|nr:adenosine kinase [Bacteriovoracaceae bacterium]
MKYDVYGIGNALVDMEFTVNDEFFTENNVEKGLMTLVEEDRQNELLEVLHSRHQDEIKKACGGSAANTVIAVSQFGGNSFYSCKVANDETGNFYLNDLKDNGVHTKYTPETAPEGTTGKCMVMVTPDAERTMNTYLGITATFSEEELVEEEIKNSKWLYIEGYLVASPSGQKAALKAKKIAQENGVKVAFTMSDPNMVKFFKDNVAEILDGGVDLLFCNESEAMEFAQTSDLSHAREELKKVAKRFAITLGKNGAILWDEKTFIDIEPYATSAVDSNGAGDMFAGAFLYALTSGHGMAAAGSLASLASSKIVSQFGPRLTWTEAKGVLNEFSETK